MNEEQMSDQLPELPREQSLVKPSAKGKSYLVWILIPVTVFLLIVAFTVGALLTLDRINAPFEDEDLGDTDVLEDEDEDVASIEGELIIDWLDFEDQLEVSPNEVLEAVLYDDTLPEFVDPSEEYALTAYGLGTVSGGDYDGYTLTMQIAALPGLGTYYQYYYILDNPEGQDVILDKYGTQVLDVFTSPVTYYSVGDSLSEEDLAQIGDNIVFDTESTIAEFEYDSSTVDIDGHEFVMTGFWHRVDAVYSFPVSAYPVVANFEDGTELRMIDEIADGSERLLNYFFRVRQDGRLELYDIEIPFWTRGEDYAGISSRTIGVPAIRWSEGGVNTIEYDKGKYGGCGYATITNVRDADEIGDMVVVGEYLDDAGNSHMVYEPAGYDSEYYMEAYATWELFNGSGTFEEYTSGHPYFLWQDDFGRWIEFVQLDLLPAAECGKPVIYLYPEEKTQINVTLEPQGGFSVTEPDYGEGWSVIAYPNGQLKNLADGEIYPYLFWEGRGGLYSEPKNYWVVPRAAVPRFLKKTLARLGLNAQETYDFMEFWVPRMQEADWYKIGFHGTEVMDIIAPMSLSVEPDMVLRILMDYSELDAPIASNAPYVPQAPTRKGFSVIEWGGVLR